MLPLTGRKIKLFFQKLISFFEIGSQDEQIRRETTKKQDGIHSILHSVLFSFPKESGNLFSLILIRYPFQNTS